MKCGHRKLPGRTDGPCATPGCPNVAMGGCVVDLVATPISAASADFGRIWIGPDGMPVHGNRGYVERTYRHSRDERGWDFELVSTRTVQSKSAEEVCRELWRDAELRSVGTDEAEAQP